MDVQVKKLPKSEVELTIKIPYETYKEWEKKAFEQIGKEIKVPGFRSGNIPEDIIRENVNDEIVRTATLDFVLPQTYAEAVKANDIQVITMPKIDIKSDVKNEGDEFVYVATVAVMPEVTVGDYKKIKVTRKEAKVDKENVEKTIGMIMDRYAEWKDVDRKAEKGDRAELDFEGFDGEGKPIANTASKNHPVVIGNNVMVPGFEDSIIGMSKGETKEFEVEFPKDYHAESLKEKKVKFKTTLNRLEEKLEQKFDDAMVEKIVGAKKTADEFRKLVEDDLLSEMERRNQEEHDNAVVSEIIKITKADIPQAMIDQEVEHMLEEQKARVKQQGLEWEQFLNHIKKAEDDFKKDHAKSAEKRILARLGVQHIIKETKVSATDEETEAKISEIVSKYPEDQRQKILDHYKKGEEAYRYLKNSLAADKLIDMLTNQ